MGNGICVKTLPFFNLRAGITPKIFVASTDVEIIKLDKKNFEKKNPFFWFYFECTIGRLLAQYIEHKSQKIIIKHLNGDLNQALEDDDSFKFLATARESFGAKRIKKLFQLRTRYFNASSLLLQHFCENVADAAALDDVYNVLGSFILNNEKLYPVSAKPDFFSRFYLNCPNGQSVRNRYRLVTNIYKQLCGGKTLSIACGSSQPLIQSVYELREQDKDQGIELLLTDISTDALALAKKRAEQAGILDKISCHEVAFYKLKKYFKNEKFDTIEACGILDYLSDKSAVSLLKFAISALNKNGKIIVSNMNATRGANLLRKMYNWEINYRTPEALGQLIHKAGGIDIKIYIEPWNIHPVATASA